MDLAREGHALSEAGKGECSSPYQVYANHQLDCDKAC